MTEQLHGISGAARQVGCAETTLRALERRGLIKPARDSAGRRLYTAADIEAARLQLRKKSGTQNAAA